MGVFSSQRAGDSTHKNELMDKAEETRTRFDGEVGYLIGGNTDKGESISLKLIHVYLEHWW